MRVNHLGICATIRNYCQYIGEEPNIQDDGKRRYRQFFGLLPPSMVDMLVAGGASVETNGTITTVSMTKD